MKKAKKSSKQRDTNLSKCRSIIDLLRHMSVKRDQLIADGQSAAAIMLEGYASQLTKIQNNQAVFLDALKRSLYKLRNRIDGIDASVSVMASHAEAALINPFSFDETHRFEEVLDAIDAYKGNL